MIARTTAALLANVVIALGIALLRWAQLGNDPFSAMMMAIHAYLPLDYGTFCLLANLVMFIAQLLWGRQTIGVGTLINGLLLGYFVDFWNLILGLTGITPANLVFRGVLAAAGIVIAAFGLSFYVAADVGVAPYDSLALILRERLHFSVMVTRVCTDGTAILTCILLKGVFGAGTVMAVFGLGILMGFFEKHTALPFYRRVFHEKQA